VRRTLILDTDRRTKGVAVSVWRKYSRMVVMRERGASIRVVGCASGVVHSVGCSMVII